MEELCFIIEGAFGIYHTGSKSSKQLWPQLKNTHKEEKVPAIILKHSSIFGDYQLLFDLKSNMELCPFVPKRNTSQNIKDLLELECDDH